MTDRFGPFELDRLLGRGGMAEAFIARRAGDAHAPTMVLKRIRPDHASSEEYLKRFVLEAQVASRVQHPNLVRFLEFGRVGDCHYIAMQMVRGWSLARLLEVVFEKGEPPPIDVALTIGAGILDGLGVMHAVRDEHGEPRPMLHRDVTPSNVIVTEEGRAVIIDFGITKDMLGPSLTLPGKVIGTARYMAPEHKKAEYLDTRADVFSASAILFEVLFGRHPWPPLSTIKELLRLSFDPPSLSDAERARVPVDVIELIGRGLDGDRERRYADAAAMGKALRDAPSFPKDQVAAERAAGAWARSLGLMQDTELAEPVVDLKPAEGDDEEVVWTAAGSLSTDEVAAADPKVTPSRILDLPPLPPRRDSAIEGGSATVDLASAAAVPSRQMWVWPWLGAAALVGLALVLALLLSR